MYVAPNLRRMMEAGLLACSLVLGVLPVVTLACSAVRP